MNEQFGEGYAESVAKDYVLAELGGRTIDQALAEGEAVKTVWRAVCATFDVPQKLRWASPGCSRGRGPGSGGSNRTTPPRPYGPAGSSWTPAPNTSGAPT